MDSPAAVYGSFGKLFGREDGKVSCCHEVMSCTLVDPLINFYEKTLMLGGIGGRRRRGQQRMRWLDGITDGRESE